MATEQKKTSTVPELKAQCREKNLSTKGKKSVLIQRLEEPDEHRVMCGSVPLHVTEHLSIDHLRLIRLHYETIGHPNKKTMPAWKSLLTGFNGVDAHLYAIAQNLKTKGASFGSRSTKRKASETPSGSASGGPSKKNKADESVKEVLSSSSSSSSSEDDNEGIACDICKTHVEISKLKSCRSDGQKGSKCPNNKMICDDCIENAETNFCRNLSEIYYTKQNDGKEDLPSHFLCKTGKILCEDCYKKADKTQKYCMSCEMREGCCGYEAIPSGGELCALCVKAEPWPSKCDCCSDNCPLCDDDLHEFPGEYRTSGHAWPKMFCHACWIKRDEDPALDY